MTTNERIASIQEAVRNFGFDGWLFCDFHNRDPISYRVLGLEGGKFTSRRWFYFVPAHGEPVGLVHAVEKRKLDPLPGRKAVYLPWEQLHAELRQALGKPGRIAMQYSPANNIPYVDLADPGLVELVRSFGHEVVSSADLVQQFEAVLSDEQLGTHIEAGTHIQRIKNEAFERIAAGIRAGTPATEYEIQRFIIRSFDEAGLTCDEEWPIVAVNEHAADPHFEPLPGNTVPIRAGDMILIDLWARLNQPGAIYYDITWCGFAGNSPPDEYVRIFDVIMEARNRAFNLVKERFETDVAVYGYEVDRVCRETVEKAGYGPYFVHRTGHSIGTAVHGNGVHMDSLETKDERRLVPGICFSIEPGIYLDGRMGVRTEIDAFIGHDGIVRVSGDLQKKLVLLDV
jgi:Xaa-Pro dipeptidase